MADHPTAADLIAIARDVVLKTLVPALPEHLRLDGLMVANALGIAQREVEGDPAREARLQAGLARVYGDTSGAALTQRAAAELRAGNLPASRRAAVYAVLLQDALERVQASNPRYLRDS
jgi:hypothetical protein